jgi:hypothetical protein
MLAESLQNSCGWEELNKFLLIFFDVFQAFALCLIFSIHPKVKRVFTRNSFFRKNISSQDSDTSLAQSRTSRNSLNKEDSREPINSWNDFVIRARSSICEENLYTREPHSRISTIPDPSTANPRISVVHQLPINTISSCHSNHAIPNYSVPSLPGSYNNTKRRRSTIREIMFGAKINLSRNGLVPTPASQPIHILPKKIPNVILDDVQLFDFYYTNLNKIVISDDEENFHVSFPEDDIEAKHAMKKINRLLSFENDKPIKRLSRLMSFDESSETDVTSTEKDSNK